MLNIVFPSDTDYSYQQLENVHHHHQAKHHHTHPALQTRVSAACERLHLCVMMHGTESEEKNSEAEVCGETQRSHRRRGLNGLTGAA